MTEERRITRRRMTIPAAETEGLRDIAIEERALPRSPRRHYPAWIAKEIAHKVRVGEAEIETRIPIGTEIATEQPQDDTIPPELRQDNYSKGSRAGRAALQGLARVHVALEDQTGAVKRAVFRRGLDLARVASALEEHENGRPTELRRILRRFSVDDLREAAGLWRAASERLKERKVSHNDLTLPNLIMHKDGGEVHITVIDWGLADKEMLNEFGHKMSEMHQKRFDKTLSTIAKIAKERA